MRTSALNLAILILLLLYLQNCNSSEGTSESREDPFFGLIDHKFTEIETKSSSYVAQPLSFEPYLVAVDRANKYLFAANRVNYSIQLYDNRGQLLSTAGREGRGPGEFKTISQLHTGSDGALYVLDILLKRITKFEIANRELRYLTTLSVEPKLNIGLRAVYVTEYGIFGVFHRVDDYKTWKESFHLYKLDRQFNPIKHLITFPGNEKLRLKESFYIDQITGRTVYWTLDNQWFYYISSMRTEVNMYNIKTGRQKEEVYFHLESRKNTPETVDILMKRFDSLIEIYPAVADAIQESERLPIFDNFHSSNNRLLFDVFNAGGEGGRVILVDLETGDVKYIKTETELWRFALGDKILYGIETTGEDGPKIKMINLN